MQNDHKYSMNNYEWTDDHNFLQEWNLTVLAAKQGAHHVLHWILPMPPTSERWTSES